MNMISELQEEFREVLHGVSTESVIKDEDEIELGHLEVACAERVRNLVRTYRPKTKGLSGKDEDYFEGRYSNNAKAKKNVIHGSTSVGPTGNRLAQGGYYSTKQFGVCFAGGVSVKKGWNQTPLLYIEAVLRELINEGTVVTYMDDLVIPAENEEEGLRKLERVLKVASENGLVIKWSKCQILRKSIDFLGYVIEDSTIRPSEEKTRAVSIFLCPRVKKLYKDF
ncbi:Retrovirus-related Pol polyprotein from transposon 17.6 [Eumeta japonica]|uniref:Retrovirus-related Pol polyprotein from transposon 17.6 n=1 Tax=Eumeta variegata TaxID=151549 RepID=A0A4C1SNE3_EUMVA|nr:Retrovirus-related Pol polyprotein from transposon 17.6 [Eumeta japonica]